MAEKLRIAVVGCGMISSIYLKNLTGMHHNVEVYAVCDLNAQRAQAQAQAYQVARIMTLEEILACKEIDLVLNLTLPKLHYQINKAILEAGKHLYCEKPLSLELEQGKELVELARSKGLRIGCAPDTFLGAAIQTGRALLDSDAIGQVIGGTAFMLCHGWEKFHQEPYFYYQKGAGPMFDMGPYYMTALVNLLGPARTITGFTAQSSKTRTVLSEQHRGDTITVEVPTHVSGNILFENGAIINVITSFDVWNTKHPFFELYGTKGTLILPNPDLFTGEVLLGYPKDELFNNDFTPVEVTAPYQENSRGLGLADLADAMKTGREHRANGDLALHVLEMMHAFYNSASSGQYYQMTTTCQRPAALPADTCY